MALLSLIEEISTHHNHGNVVKKKRTLPELSFAYGGGPAERAGFWSIHCSKIIRTAVGATAAVFLQPEKEGRAPLRRSKS